MKNNNCETPIVIIKTKRLIIRQYTPADADQLMKILSDKETMAYWPRPFTQEEVRMWIARNMENYQEKGFGRYAIVLRESQEIIGDCGILEMEAAGKKFYDFSYIIHKNYWNRGFATEAAKAIRDYAFESLELEALHANMPSQHAASRRVAEKIGMRRIGEFHNSKNKNIKTVLYSASRECY